MMSFVKGDKPESDEQMHGWLRRLGYDSDLYPVRSRLFTLTLPSDHPIELQ
jgi:hypothetical protein